MNQDIPRLICNADDFGLTRQVSEAIVHCHKNGIVSSTTLMTNMPAFEYSCELSRNNPSLGVGIHLTLTEGWPVTTAAQVPSLVDCDGLFLDRFAQRVGLARDGRRLLPQVMAEWRAQISKAIDNGVNPTHLDSHHSIHRKGVPRFAIAALAREFGINKVRTPRGYHWPGRRAGLAVRLRCVAENVRHLPRWASRQLDHVTLRYRYRVITPDHKLSAALRLNAVGDDREQFIAAVKDLPNGCSEMSFHPGYPNDPELQDPADFAGVRQTDLSLLTDPRVVEAVRENARLIHFGQM